MKREISINVRLLLGIAALIIGVLYGCQLTDRDAECLHTDFNSEGVDIKELEYNDLPYVRGSKMKAVKEFYDEDSIPIHDFKGQKNYHPVFLAQYGLHTMDVYRTTRDNQYLDALVKLCHKVESIALKKDSVIYFPYEFDFPLHSNQMDVMKAPWYSGMAQGQLLSLFCRMYEETNNEFYLNVSERIFNSFTQLRGDGHEPWVSCVTKDGDLWLEEYPVNLPNFTLNGHIFAIYGLYDYFRLTNRPEVLPYLKASILTVKNNIHLFRNEGDISSYCLKHKVKSMSYHGVHIEQLHQLYLYTGDEYFEEMSLAFAKDTKGVEED